MAKSLKSAFNLHGQLLLYIASAWLVGIFLASLVALSSLWFLLGVAGGLILLVLCWSDHKARLILFLASCLLLGAWRYTTATLREDPQSIARFIGDQPLQILGTVTDEPRLIGRSRLLAITVYSLARDKQTTWKPVDGQIDVRTFGTAIEDPYGANYGDVVVLRGKLQAQPSSSMLGTLATMTFPRVSVKQSNTLSPIAMLYHLRLMLANIIERALPQPEAALLVAIFLSIRTSALKPLLPAFNATGIAHLIAPSGFKVTILAGLVGKSMALFHKGRAPGLARQRVTWQSWLVTGLKVASVGIYTMLSGAGPAAIRAGVMGILLVIAPHLGRRYNVYTALAATALVMSSIHPFVLWDASFQLSFLGTLGIVLFTPFLQRFLQPLARIPAGHHLMEIIAVTMAAQIATLPIFAVTFQEISLVAPLANMLTVPLFSTMIVLGLCVCCVGIIWQPLAIPLAWIAWPVLWYVIHAAQWCFTLPGAYFNIDVSSGWIIWAAWCYYALLLLGLSFLLRTGTLQAASVRHHTASSSFLTLSPRAWGYVRVSSGLLMVIITGLTALIAPSSGILKIALLHVAPANQPSQGDTIVIQTPDGKTVLIDAGLDVASLSQVLDSRLPLWQRSLDAVILTTAEQDHITGLQDIIQRYYVSTVVDAGMLHPNAAYTRWRRTIRQGNLRYFSVAQGTTIPLGVGVSLQVIWPGQPLHKSSDEARDNALVMYLIAPGLRILLLGVAAQSKYALNGLLNALSSNYLQAQIVQMVGENKTPFPVELKMVLQRATPSLLLVTPGALSGKQRKGGENTMLREDTLSTLTQASWQVMQTAQVGTIEIRSNNAGWNFSTAF